MRPPSLVIRRRAFWVESSPPQDATATLEAFADGGYSGTWWYDAAGGVWTVEEATLKDRPSVLDRALQRPVPVELRFAARADGDLAEALARLHEVLFSKNEFCDELETPPGEIWA